MTYKYTLSASGNSLTQNMNNQHKNYKQKPVTSIKHNSTCIYNTYTMRMEKEKVWYKIPTSLTIIPFTNFSLTHCQWNDV